MSLPVYARYRAAFAGAIAEALGMPASDVEPQVKPAEPAHGDLSFATFALAKAQKKAPPAIAAALAQQVKVPGLEVKAVGPYLNARFTLLPFTAETIDTVRTEGLSFGGGDEGRGKTVVIDYSSPNIAKPIAFHHIRSTVIGHCIANLYRALGWRVEGINYLGDWGKQFGLVAVGFHEYGDPARKDDMAHLVEVYVKANARAEQEPEFDARAREFFRSMEAGDVAALELWKQFRETSLRNFERVYARLGIHFEHIEGESFYQGRMEPVVEEVGQRVGVKESQGALIVDLPYAENEPPILLKKADGSTLYVTRDLAAAVDRHERFQFEKSLYVVATDQALHFKQFFRVLNALGWPFASKLTHVNFGRVHGMSTRKGTLVLLDDALDQARELALEKVRQNIQEGRIQTRDAEALAEQIGLGAIIFGDLKHNRTSDYTFDWEEALSFEGHTGPYLQYAHARTCSVLQKSGGAPKAYDASLLTLPEEQALLRELVRLPMAVRDAAEQYEPSLVARLLLDVAAAFSRYFTAGNQDRDKRVLVEDEALRAARLVLTDATRITLAAGLTLLGIPTPESM
ncbi:arginine--tRNA ligase [Corallococcus carmarthensis]|uniref:Arginine--tRNA ligase n=1 Tax=Corallococcus carmarthensis TaxID=2316728 RepID=A0A3A8JUC9_9BACT|nr:arginine--tRNA ligase [Corallococcus carmarthensis]NOK18535.1 arginine--tRNA ligase [Corallococcus carmarthensis]RKG99477.1 arginine--tRNA ligase [Corallococcus carmarthensis]